MDGNQPVDKGCQKPLRPKALVVAWMFGLLVLAWINGVLPGMGVNGWIWLQIAASPH